MIKKKIICTVINDLNYDQRMIRICTSLQENGFDVLLLGRTKKNSIALRKRPFQQKRLNCFFQKGKFFYLEYNIRLYFYLLFHSFDIINPVDLDTILPGYYASKIKKKKIVFDAHEYFTEVPEVMERPKVQKIWKRIERKIIPKLNYAYTVCQSIAELFEKEYGTTFQVIRNVPFYIESKNIKKENKIILYQGALNEGRGLEAMIDAMQQIEGAEFWLAGEGDLSNALRERVTAKKLNNKIKFLGFLQPEELKELTYKAYIGVNLLENKGLSYYYSLANKSFDYIQALVPALHMDFPEYKILNQQFEIGILLKDLEVSTIQEKIQILLTDDHYYQEIVNQCKKAKEIWTWENEEKILLNIYNHL